MDLLILAVGSLKEPYMKKAQEELLGLLRKKPHIGRVAVVEVAEAAASDHPSDKDVAKTLKTEGEALLKRVPKNSFLCCLTLDGQTCREDSLVDLCQKAVNADSLVFVIGGSHGIAEEVKRQAQAKLNFSGLTFPHQLFRIALLDALGRYL